MTKLPRIKSEYLQPGARNTKEARAMLKKFGAAVKSLRQERGYRGAAFARLIGATSQKLCNIEKGRNWPKPPMYADICVALRLGRPPLL